MITIMNFSRIYERQHFYKQIPIKWIDCTQMSSTNGYADDTACSQFQKMLASIDEKGIHFIDNGNHHYLSKIWLDKIQEDCQLIVFDHHSDMQRPAFSGLLSCGSWILDTLDHHPNIQKTVLVGLSEEQKNSITEYKNRIVCIDEKQSEKIHQLDLVLDPKLPVYLSIDKDVLSNDEVHTTWDQGIMSVDEMKELVCHIMKIYHVIGMGICGNPLYECSDDECFKDDEINHFFVQFDVYFEESNRF